jgi:PIN domain nuclease of toxin-antitoxin system
MKFLLDTHILIWSLKDPAKLPVPIKTALDDEKNELWLSPISVWEMLLLAEKGRAKFRTNNPGKWLRNALTSLPIKEAPITHEVAIRSREIDLPHQDPADRFILATALVFDLVLMTVDQKLIDSKYHGTIFGCQQWQK